MKCTVSACIRQLIMMPTLDAYAADHQAFKHVAAAAHVSLAERPSQSILPAAMAR